MPEFRNNGSQGSSGSSVPDELVAKAGRAIGKVVQIREVLHQRLGSAGTDDERQQLSSHADQAATAAISEEGLSVDQYAQILAAADEDTELEERLLAAAQEAE
jgi:hypothetical protein